MADVASTYLLLRQLDLQLEISRRTVATNDETVRFYEARLKGGVSNRLEVDQALGNRARTATVIPQLEREIAITENALCLLLGRLPGPIERGAPLADQQVPPAIPAGLPASLIERRPDVLGAEQLLVAANANVGAAKALFFPTISLTGLLGTISGDFSNLLKADSNIWQVSPSLFAPIFQGGRIRRNYDASKARYEQALAGTRSRRSTATGRSPTRSSASRSSARPASSSRTASTPCATPASSPAPATTPGFPTTSRS